MRKFLQTLIFLFVFTSVSGQVFIDIQAGLTGVSESANIWIDFDQDGAPDAMITGDFYKGNLQGVQSKLYRNLRNDRFVPVSSGVTNVYRGDIDVADFDLNGTPDLVLIGETANGKKITQLYRGNRTAVFNPVNAGFPGVRDGSVEWGDFDGDGDVDVLLCGESDNGPITTIYRNDRANKFVKLENNFPQISFGVSRFADFDLDGDLDVLIAGLETSGMVVTEIFQNNDGLFQRIDFGLTGLKLSDAAWGDYDNDGDLDVVICGENQQGRVATILYNNVNHKYFEPVFPGFAEVRSGSVDWADMDHDGDLDLLLTGESVLGPVSKIYRNDRNDRFTDINADLIGLYMSDGHWADYDNDGDQDVLLSGMSKDYSFISRIYRNDPAKTDTVRSNADEDIWGTSVVVQERPKKVFYYVFASCWTDLDGDGINEYNVFFSPVKRQTKQYELQIEFNNIIRRDFPLWYDFDQANIISSGFEFEKNAHESRAIAIREYETKGFKVHDLNW